MKIQLQRTLFEIINFVMAILFVIPIGVLIEQMCGYPLFRCCMIPCTAIIGYLFGRFSLTRQATVSMILCVAGVVLSVVLSVILCPGAALVTVLITLASAFFSTFFFFSARKAAYTIYAPMAVSGILIHLFVLLFCVGFQWPETVSSLTSTVAIIYFLLTLYAFSTKGLRKSLHRTNSAKRVVYPAGMQMGNFLLVTGFILVAAFISNIHPIFVLFSNGFVYVLRAIVAIFAFISSLFSRRTGASQYYTEEGTEETSIAEDSILNAEPRGEASWITTAVEIIAFILVVLFVCYAVYKAVQKLQNSSGKISTFIRGMRDRFAPTAEEDFVDETESLFDAKQLLSETGSRMKKALNKIRERPQKIDDFDDPKQKIRFVFQQILKKVTTRNPSAPTQTPNEILKAEYAGEADFEEFMEFYNEVRYSNHDLPDRAVDSAYHIIRQKL